MSAGFPSLEALSIQGKAQLEGAACRITVGMGTCGRAAGAREVFAALESALADDLREPEASVVLDAVGCKGLCYAEPLVEVCFAGCEPVTYGAMDAQLASVLASQIRDRLAAVGVEAREGAPHAGDSNAGADCHLQAAGGHGTEPAQVAPAVGGSAPPSVSLDEHVIDDYPFDLQQRRVMSNCGVIAPASLAQYVARGGYEALLKALSLPPSQVIDIVIDANIRGRGGAGFPAGAKWRACANADADERYFIVNGDEGDPGAYMDRGLLESDPHRVLEGLIIGCYATGAHKAYYFIRAEYPLAVETVKRALADAREVGLVGRDILGSGFDLEIDVVRGAGAFLCGESTAMVNVLENGECTTRPKPPHLTERGLWGKPTCINNVETLANVPLVLTQGAEWFKQVGTAQSPGTKIFSVTGSVARGGLIEVGLGTSLGTIVGDIAQAGNPKAVQVGGPSGAILPASMEDLPMSFEGLSDVGGMIGSGGFVVIGQDQCVVDTASYLVHFSAGQSCRKCKPCRDGLDESAALFDRITAGEGTSDDLERLRSIAERNCASKLCGLGRTALSPVLSSLRFFRDEYEAHLQGRCPGLTCTALVSYEIDQVKCQGERCCLLTCPGNAVKGRFGKAGHIVARLCQKCGMCVVTCPYGAVRKVSP